MKKKKILFQKLLSRKTIEGICNVDNKKSADKEEFYVTWKLEVKFRNNQTYNYIYQPEEKYRHTCNFTFLLATILLPGILHERTYLKLTVNVQQNSIPLIFHV